MTQILRRKIDTFLLVCAVAAKNKKIVLDWREAKFTELGK